MTDRDNLRDRLSDVIDRALSAWMTVDDALDGPVEGSEEDFVAQAIIDEFGLAVEAGHITGQGYGLPGVIGKRVVGKWEKQ